METQARPKPIIKHESSYFFVTNTFYLNDSTKSDTFNIYICVYIPRMSDWVPITSKKSGKVYWYNKKTKKSSWTKPGNIVNNRTTKKVNNDYQQIIHGVAKRLVHDAVCGRDKFNILELGCGKGLLYKHIKDTYGETCVHYIGIDSSKNKIKQALASVQPNSSPLCTFIHHDLTNGIPRDKISIGCIDIVYVHSLHYIWGRDLIETISQYLVHGGRFVGTFLDYNIVKNIVEKRYKVPKTHSIQQDVTFTMAKGEEEMYFIKQKYIHHIQDNAMNEIFRSCLLVPLVYVDHKKKRKDTTGGMNNGMYETGTIMYETFHSEPLVQFAHTNHIPYHEKVDMEVTICGMYRVFVAVRRDHLFRVV